MLTYEALIEQAKLRGMPCTKDRGILREYLHIVMLKQLYKTDIGKQMLFTGGTYLRLVHNLKRFSEDLDFNSNKIEQQAFEVLCKKLVTELRRLGIESKIDFSHWDNILVGRFTFPDIEPLFGIVSKHTRKQGLLIKLEVNRPKWEVKTETEVISGYGEIYPCICTNKSMLFADKIDALVKKKIGRHLFDIIFMLSNKFPIDHKILKSFGITQNPLAIIVERANSFSKGELKRLAEILRPFLFDEAEANLIINAPTIIEKLVQTYG